MDAEGKTLGRFATEIAVLLMGKHKPIYQPHRDTGDHVVIVNAAFVVVHEKAMDNNESCKGVITG